ncbi:hypothetical protein VTI74DRAFT_3326 [Chaetomium olivicolor]
MEAADVPGRYAPCQRGTAGAQCTCNSPCSVTLQRAVTNWSRYSHCIHPAEHMLPNAHAPSLRAGGAGAPGKPSLEATSGPAATAPHIDNQPADPLAFRSLVSNRTFPFPTSPLDHPHPRPIPSPPCTVPRRGSDPHRVQSSNLSLAIPPCRCRALELPSSLSVL